jgi:exodeoxyribonuclease VII large subunit
MNDKLSLTELQLIIKDSLYMALPGMYWVVAEISEIKENYAGHCYIELVEKNRDEINIRARVRAVIWAKRYSFLKPLFLNITGESLKEGFKVLLKVTVEYHEIYGLSLVINDIDPSFTIGEMAVKRQQIIRKLEDEGVFSMNKELDFPALPKRIAVISSKNAAGYSDFLKHLTGNNYGYSFCTALFDASMQGTDTEKSVTEALDRISENITLFDTVVIIRGGGSQTDLSWFDNYRIAYFIIETVSETDSLLTGMSTSISELSMKVIAENMERIDRFRMRLIPVAGLKIAEGKNRLSSDIISLINTGKECIIREGIVPANCISRLVFAVRSYSAEKENSIIKYLNDLQNNSVRYLIESGKSLETLNSNLNILNPENVLKRGYTITSLNGLIVKNASSLKEGDLIDTRFSDGEVRSKVNKQR